MKKRIIFLIFILAFLSCRNNHDDINTAKCKEKKRIEIFGDTIREIENLNIKNKINTETEIENWFQNNFFLNLKYKTKANIISSSKSIEVYGVFINDKNAPTSLNKYYTLVYFKSSHKSYLLPVECNCIFNIQSHFMVGGFYNYRGYEFYIIYKYENNSFLISLDTRNISNNLSVIVGCYRNDECIEYDKNRFGFLHDKNETIIFTGRMRFYCKDGGDRISNTSYKEEKVKIIFHYKNNRWIYDKKESNYVFW